MKSKNPMKFFLLRKRMGVMFLVVLALISEGECQGLNRKGNPDWEVKEKFLGDSFTFVRLQGRNHPNWRTDYPDSDLNFSYRLQEMTTITVNPDPVLLNIDDEKLFEYPFSYMVDVGRWKITDGEAEALREYLSKGGFLYLDDFWGDMAWANVEEQIQKIFPDGEVIELGLEHPIFHQVFDLKELVQVPAIHAALRGRAEGITYEGGPHNYVRYQAVFDKEGRMVLLAGHNTDLGDGWEREGESKWYFHEFAEKRAYPMGINILFYALTH